MVGIICLAILLFLIHVHVCGSVCGFVLVSAGACRGLKSWVSLEMELLVVGKQPSVGAGTKLRSFAEAL